MRKKLFSILFFLAMIFGTGRIAFANEQISAEISGDGQNQLSVKVRNSSNSEVNDVSYQLNLPQGYKVDEPLPTSETLLPGQTQEFKVKIKQEQVAVLPKTGEKIITFSVIGFIVLLLGLILLRYSYSRRLLLTFLVISGSAFGAALVSADTLVASLVEFSQSVRLFDKDVPVRLTVYYRSVENPLLGEKSSLTNQTSVNPATEAYVGSSTMPSQTDTQGISGNGSTSPVDIGTPAYPSSSSDGSASTGLNSDSPVTPVDTITVTSPSDTGSSLGSQSSPGTAIPSPSSDGSGSSPTVSSADSPVTSVDSGTVPTASDNGAVVTDPSSSVDTLTPSLDSGASGVVPSPTVPDSDSPVTSVDSGTVPTVSDTGSSVGTQPSTPVNPNQSTNPDTSSSEKNSKGDELGNSSDSPKQGSAEEVLLSGHAFSNLTGRGIEFGTVTLKENGKEIQTIETDSDGYFYVHLTKGKTYTLHGKDFEASITANGNNDFQVHNILGKFAPGRNNSDAMGKVVLNPSVVQLDVVDYQVDEKAGQVILPEEKKLKPGDVIVLPASGNYPTGFAFKVVTSKVADGKTVLTVTKATLEEVAKEINVQTEFDLDGGTFTPAEGTSVEEDEGEDLGNRASVSASAAARKTWKKKIKGVDVGLKVTGKVEAKLDWAPGRSPHVFVKPSLNFKLTTDFKKEASFEDKVKLVTVNFSSYYGVVVSVDIYVFLNAEGKFNISTESNFDVAAELGVKNQKAYFDQNVQLSNKLDLNIYGQIKEGPMAVFKPGFLNLSVASFDVAVGLGLEGELNAQVTQKNLDSPKLEKASGRAVLFADLTLGYEVGFSGLKLEGKFLDSERFFERLMAKGEYKPNSGKRKLKDVKPLDESDETSSDDDTSDSSDDSENHFSNTFSLRNLQSTRKITNIKIGELPYNVNNYRAFKFELMPGPDRDGELLREGHYHYFDVSDGTPIYYTLYDLDKNGFPELVYLVNGEIEEILYAYGQTSDAPPYVGLKPVHLPKGYSYIYNYKYKYKILEDGTIITTKEEDSSRGESPIDYEIIKVDPVTKVPETVATFSRNKRSQKLYRYRGDIKNDKQITTISQAEKIYLTAPEVDWESLTWQPFVRRYDWAAEEGISFLETE
ncbi:MAG: LPXTG cell wall anchor domain-containing protein [Streptococcus sanguinis]|nr:LPXTG cell wall anchor domain-containing protein [Streptococcus sanguinis]